MPKGKLKTYGFRIYIYRNQKHRGMMREGVIAFLNEKGKQVNQEQFDFLDEIPMRIRKRLRQLEKEEE